ncbi:sigma-70 family RNA polymerase sigma factor [Falsiroseomonas oryziterrae]|uniref:sigma-70 family RNA polymerase sigma factor n=1 Tax=Falsiroseomonas oryziterrae TaxID=2911368 RepID=UPI001F01A789|nr:sigma-70 family RNA polymerase sigma factor [Roseomonas sp. NPKOSM-4]
MDRQDDDTRLRAAIAQLLPEFRAAARLLTASRAEADDVVQDAVIRMLHGLDSFVIGAEHDGDVVSALRPWGLAVLRNAFREAYRRRKREREHLEAALPAEQGQSGGQETVARMRDLARALAVLPPALREALVLVGAQGLSHEQAAAVCDVPVGTMKARVSRARRQLAKALAHPLEAVT